MTKQYIVTRTFINGKLDRLQAKHRVVSYTKAGAPYIVYNNRREHLTLEGSILYHDVHMYIVQPTCMDVITDAINSGVAS